MKVVFDKVIGEKYGFKIIAENEIEFDFLLKFYHENRAQLGASFSSSHYITTNRGESYLSLHFTPDLGQVAAQTFPITNKEEAGR